MLETPAKKYRQHQIAQPVIHNICAQFIQLIPLRVTWDNLRGQPNEDLFRAREGSWKPPLPPPPRSYFVGAIMAPLLISTPYGVVTRRAGFLVAGNNMAGIRKWKTVVLYSSRLRKTHNCRFQTAISKFCKSYTIESSYLQDNPKIGV